MTQDELLKELVKRVGKDHVENRLLKEKGGDKMSITFGYWDVALGTSHRILSIAKFLLKVLGLWNHGVKMALKYQIVEEKVVFPKLPPQFDGYRIMHLSDLHLEGIVDGGKSFCRMLEGLETDLCVITGDFRHHNWGESSAMLELLKPIIQKIHCRDGILAVLGNHDGISIVPGMEKLGLRVLLNESLRIKREHASIWIGGVDDPHFYRLHELEQTMKGTQEEEFKILLAHSADIVYEAVKQNVDYYLCGHTHGGQICLPGGIPIIANMKLPRKFFAGSWQEGHMKGYTSRGVGTSDIPVRLFSKPEIVIHKLIRT
jgi:uncharacterized protein